MPIPTIAEIDLSDALDRGITVTEIAPMDQPIDALAETTAAFVGRALRGPLETPILIRNFGEFRRRFGGVWTGSSLGPAVEQFFAHGGKQLYVVRVANNAHGATLCLPAIHGVLKLVAVEPGSSEHVRAAVDYDGIDPVDGQRFNLTVQRIDPESGLIRDQEIFRSLTCTKGEEENIEEVLLSSDIVRAELPLPANKPMPTGTNYVGHQEAGTDGSPLSDYDLIGSASRGTGLFALNRVEHFDLLYLPPPALGAVPGPAAVLAAELYCRKRGAMLILDPPEHWKSPRDAVHGIRADSYANPNALLYFPRMYTRRDDGSAPRAIGGAIAGLLCKLDRNLGPWEELDQRGYTLSRDLVPAVQVSADDAHLLVKEGINVVAGTVPGHSMVCGSVTTARGVQAEAEFASLTHRRLCLNITNAIDRATRWAVFEPNGNSVKEQVTNQVHAFMQELAGEGALADDQFVVHCDTGRRQAAIDPEKGITIMIAFRAAGAEQTTSLTLHQTMAGCRVSSTAFAPVRAECA